MGVTIKGRPLQREKAPEPLPATDILAALQKYASLSKPPVLLLVNQTSGEHLRVLSYDPQTTVATLKTSWGPIIHPKIGEREARIYRPFWRD